MGVRAAAFAMRSSKGLQQYVAFQNSAEVSVLLKYGDDDAATDKTVVENLPTRASRRSARTQGQSGCPDHKYKALQNLSESFQAEHGREPSLWIDKYCIDQYHTLINKSPIYLPIFVNVPKQRIVVKIALNHRMHGPTCYFFQLCCMWEFYVMKCSDPRLGNVLFWSIAGTRLQAVAPNTSKKNSPASRFKISKVECSSQDDKNNSKTTCWKPRQDSAALTGTGGRRGRCPLARLRVSCTCISIQFAIIYHIK